MTYTQFSNRFTRLCNKVFDQEMFARLMLAKAFLGEGESLLDKFKPTVNMFGSAEQADAYDKLVKLVRDKPAHSKRMHYVSTP